MNLKNHLVVSVALGALLLPEAAFSQAKADEIIVTARKIEESILDIPLSVTAVTAEEIEGAGLDNLVDLAAYTPGFQLESFNSVPGRYDSTPFIRGVVFDSTDALRQTVSVFVDGVYVSGGNQSIDFQDVARVEVIKGPQSAQFGRSTFAGAVNYITADPAAEFGGNASVLVATRDEYEMRGSLEGPLLGESVTARISGRYNFDGGHYRNTLDTSQELGEEETWSVSGMVMFAPNDAFKSKVRAFYTQMDDGPSITPLLDSSFNSGPFVPGGETIFAGVLPEFPESAIGFNTTDADFEAFITDAESRGVNFIITPDQFGLDREAFRLSWDGQYDFSNGMAFNFIAGYSQEQVTSLVDTDSSPDRTYTLYAGRDFQDLQAEARLSGTAFSDDLFWSAGVNFYKLDYATNGAFGLQAFGQSSSFGNLGEITEEDVETFGVFGKLDWQASDLIGLSLEGRYQEDSIDQGPQANDTFKNFLPRATLNLTPNNDTLLYATYSEGNLPGGFNSNFFDLNPDQVTALQTQFAGLSSSYLEETLRNYEIGWKQDFGGKMNLQLALYRMERKDQVTRAIAQLPNPDFPADPTAPPIVTETFNVNAAATTIEGIELETNWYPTDELSMRATIAYTNAEISDFPASGDSGDFEDVFLSDDGFIGTKAERYPPLQLTLSATYEKPIGNFAGLDSSWFTRGDFLYSEGYFLSTPNLGKTPEVSDVRLRTGLRNDRFSIEAFVTNLLEETAPTAGNNYIDLSNQTPLFSFGVESVVYALRDKRQFGVRASMNF